MITYPLPAGEGWGEGERLAKPCVSDKAMPFTLIRPTATFSLREKAIFGRAWPSRLGMEAGAYGNRFVKAK